MTIVDDCGYLLNLPTTRYGQVHELQLSVVTARHTGHLDRDMVMMVEHTPVFTMGRRGGRSNLLISENELEARGVDLVPIERGGDITYHGPGQLVVYVLMELAGRDMGVRGFVSRLEMAMAKTAGHWGIIAKGDDANRGAWIGHRKLGSVGVTVRRGITFHGLAMNVSTELTPFQWINPCGLKGCQMTSLEMETGYRVEMASVRRQMVRHLEALFDIELKPIGLEELNVIVGSDN